MKAKKRSSYDSKIESLLIQNETESKTIKELLSPAAFEKLKKAQSALPQVSTRRRKLRNFNCFMSKEALFEAHQVQLRKSVKKKPEKEEKKRKVTIWDRRLNDIRNAEVKTLLEEILDSVEKKAELQGILDEIEKEKHHVRQMGDHLKFTMESQPWCFKVETNEVELSDGCGLEAEPNELWEPKVELLEVEEDVQFPHLPIFAEKQSGIQDPTKENEELPISYVSVPVEQLSRLVGFQQEPDNSEKCPFQMQIFQLSAVPVEGGLIETKKESENAEEVPSSSFIPVDQQSNFYVLY